MIPAPSTGDPTGACRWAVFSFFPSTCARKVETIVSAWPEVVYALSIKIFELICPPQ